MIAKLVGHHGIVEGMVLGRTHGYGKTRIGHMELRVHPLVQRRSDQGPDGHGHQGSDRGSPGDPVATGTGQGQDPATFIVLRVPLRRLLQRACEPTQLNGADVFALQGHLLAQLLIGLQLGLEAGAILGGKRAQQVGFDPFEAFVRKLVPVHGRSFLASRSATCPPIRRSFIMQRYLMVRMLPSSTPSSEAMAARSRSSK